MVKMHGESVRAYYDQMLLIENMKNVAVYTALQFIFVEDFCVCVFVVFFASLTYFYLLQQSFAMRARGETDVIWL